MKIIGSKTFSKLLAIRVYRSITGQLFECCLITQREYEQISHRIDAMEDEIINPQEAERHRRKATAV